MIYSKGIRKKAKIEIKYSKLNVLNKMREANLYIMNIMGQGKPCPPPEFLVTAVTSRLFWMECGGA